jgi:DNA primase
VLIPSPDRDAEKQLVKSRSPIDQVVRELAGCEFESRGPGDLWACCPFHSEDTPSFHVRVGHGMYKCFGCTEAGDVFNFVQKIRGVGFREALEFLAERCGVTLGSLSAEDKRRQSELRDLRVVLTRAGELFAKALRSPEGAQAVAYLKARGFEGQTAHDFDVGLVPPEFLSRLRSAGLSSAAIDRAGFTNQFSGRLSFGIRDANGGLVGFGARTLDPDGKPKYVNTRETSAFNKRSLLYGLNKASRVVARSRRMVLMEGYTDVLMAHQQGLQEAVATMGTSLTEEHVRMLKGRASNLVFVFDGDAAGMSAAERAVNLTLKEGIEVRVLCLPDGTDPGEWFMDHDLEAFETLLAAEGMSTVSFLCLRAIEAADHSQPGWREQVARQVLETCRNIVDPIRREKVAEEVSRACSVDRNLLRKQVHAQAPAGGAHPAPSRNAAPGAAGSARIRSQFVVVAGLAQRADAAEAVERFIRLKILDHPHALQLVELSRTLGEAPVNGMEWLDATREHAPRLTNTLEKALFQEPGSVIPSYETAFEHLETLAELELVRQARRSALSRPGVEQDQDALRAIQDSLTDKQPPAADTSTPPPESPTESRDALRNERLRYLEDDDTDHPL